MGRWRQGGRAAAAAPGGEGAKPPTTLDLKLRKRVETKEGSGRFHTVVQPTQWDAGKTAAVVCDMWDLHHCLNAVRREGEMAPRMNEVLKALRSRGVLIIHAPSSCMDAYQDHPARKRAQQTPRAKNLPKEIGQWCRQIPAEEKGAYPIDQLDGGEDDDPEEHRQWAAKLESLGAIRELPGNPKSTSWKSTTETSSATAARRSGA